MLESRDSGKSVMVVINKKNVIDKTPALNHEKSIQAKTHNRDS